MSAVADAYQSLVAAGELKPDPDQARAVEALDRFAEDLKERDGGWLKRLTGRRDAPCGVYMWGGVGRGKSMLMDLFHAAVDTERKRRVHFHRFMQEVQAGLHEARKTGVEPSCRRSRRSYNLKELLNVLTPMCANWKVSNSAADFSKGRQTNFNPASRKAAFVSSSTFLMFRGPSRVPR